MHRRFLLPLTLAAITALVVVGRRTQGAYVQRGSAATEARGTRQSHLPTIAILPDTQYYASTFPDVLAAQTTWIVRNRGHRHLAAVLQLGDLVDTWSSEPQWRAVSASLRALDGQVPYLVVPGNHDTDRTRQGPINQYFAPSTMPWIRGTMVPGRIENNYAVLDIGQRAWLVLGLEFAPRDAALAWAGEVLRAHADLPAIVVTHAYLYEDGSRYGMTQPGSGDHVLRSQRFAPQAFDYTPGQGINDGELIWRKLVLPNRNVQLLFCGHDNGVARLTSVRPDGSRVHQILSDYQWLYQGDDNYEGGSGFLRLVAFDYADQAIHVETYSPYLDRYLTDDGNQFTLPLDLGRAPEARLGAHHRSTR
jgi:3',5'-cyclic AMP phosphodiesterase CpdA